ncbi:Rha family transcriptional regulator [Sphingobium sp. CR2-8]|uniref:Rha family transcriptional regulator n=1 Tax=Sphingobium sp. CR2-8 TaxID=1306534 RepID=UPI002DBF4886|nr:Rha family transcriptional regulator [Sphingobium sp. CR2-8]MEC3912196.1 Rha family transcriptional regulator [Sphingobium sp. CR2-8]
MPESIDTPNSPIVIVKDGSAVADSRNIALAFGKQHKDVIRKVDALVVEAPELNGRNFTPVLYEDAKGEMRRAYEMDRFGFSLLAMRFTGAKALQWQIAYVAEFERMEFALHAGGQIGIVEQFSPAARSTIGGILKRVTHSELQEMFGQVVPRLVEPMLERMVNERLLTGDRKVVQGVSALEVAEMAGYGTGNRPRGLSQFITSKLMPYHIQRKHFPERSPHGAGKVWVYVELIARAWLVAGGRAEIDAYVAERKGQGKLRLVSA